MCNEVARLRALDEIILAFSQQKIPLRFPDGLPNLAPAPSIRITDPAVIVRPAAASPADDAAAELVRRRWSWSGGGGAGAAGKPVYNFRSEGRRFAPLVCDAAGAATGGRAIVPVDAFFEFTDPAPGAKRKTKWRFTAADGGLLGIAGIWRAGVVPAGRSRPAADEATDPSGHGNDAADGDAGGGRDGEAFTLLTCAPGPDVAPYHSRQIVLLPRDRWADWLAGTEGLIAPAPAGMLRVEPAG